MKEYMQQQLRHKIGEPLSGIRHPEATKGVFLEFSARRLQPYVWLANSIGWFAKDDDFNLIGGVLSLTAAGASQVTYHVVKHKFMHTLSEGVTEETGPDPELK